MGDAEFAPRSWAAWTDGSVTDARREVYGGSGVLRIPGFVSPELADRIGRRWCRPEMTWWFAARIANLDVRFDSPHYLVRWPSEDDLSFCNAAWMPPVDEELHDVMVEANAVRNLVEGRPRVFGTRPFDDRLLQYRVSRSVSPGPIVRPHADFTAMARTDPMGDHTPDPSRLQLTLLLSTHGEHYTGGGFAIRGADGHDRVVGVDLPGVMGDLLVWRYDQTHSVGDIEVLDDERGFCRVIGPMFDRAFLEGHGRPSAGPRS